MDFLAEAGLGLDYGVVRFGEVTDEWLEAGVALRDRTEEVLTELAAGVEQVGSAAVRGLTAKPIVDLAVGLSPSQDAAMVTKILETQGWIYRGDAGDSGGHVFVLETKPWHRVAHLHVVSYGGTQWLNYLRFRDLLRDDCEARERYSKKKLELFDRYSDDREAYTLGKASIVQELLDGHDQTTTTGSSARNHTKSLPRESNSPENPACVAGRATLCGMQTVTWTQMAEGTQADYETLVPAAEEHLRGTLVGNLVAMLATLRGPKLGYQVDRFEHSLQSATRAYRNDEPVDMVVGALLHDVADSFAPENHSKAAASIIEPYVDERTTWVVKHHGVFQGYYYFHHLGGDRETRSQFVASPFYDDCVWFCQEYDQNCFDPGYDSMSLADFEPMLDEVFSRPSRLPLSAQ